MGSFDDYKAHHDDKYINAHVQLAESMCISKVQLEDTTVSWLLSVFDHSLQKVALGQRISPVWYQYLDSMDSLCSIQHAICSIHGLCECVIE